MPSVRIERVPVRALGLGVLGFDHLAARLRACGGENPEDGWFVLEGLREASATGVRLGVEGLHGATTLAEANGGATGAALTEKIGTAEARGSREIASGSEASSLWATFVANASDIEAQGFPYIAYALPGSPLPTINSSSLVSTLLHRADLDIAQSKPDSMRLSPGTETLLGTPGDDVLARPGLHHARRRRGLGLADRLLRRAAHRQALWRQKATTTFNGRKAPTSFMAASRELAYADDGADTVHYTGIGQGDCITANPAPVPHLAPGFHRHVR